MTPADLVQRIACAPGGAEDLDAEVVALLNHAQVRRYPPTDDFGPRQRWQFWSLDGAHFLGNEANPKFKIHPYTRSIDAALQLIPSGWRLYALQEEFIYPPGLWFAGLDHRTDNYAMGSQVGKAPTPALALVIAALLARQKEGR